MNILIVDDQPTDLKLLRAQLEAEGHVVFEAHDGVDALVLLNRQRVDAVISDILMPRMDGYRLCHEIRKHTRLRDLPVIIYTATYTSPGESTCAGFGGALASLGRAPEAEPELLAALAMQPDFIEAHGELASVYARTGRMAEAVHEAERALDLATASGQAAAGQAPSEQAALRAALAARLAEYRAMATEDFLHRGR